MTATPLTLYASPMSLWSGRARSYLIKANIDYREEPHASQHFMEVVLPKAGGRRGIPTLEFPDGRVIRDGVAIVDHFEAERGNPHTPATPRQRIAALLFDVIGAEGLVRPCMHYRWHFPEEDEFLLHHFRPITPWGGTAEMTGEARIRINREVVTPLFGAAAEHSEAIEALYADVVDALDAHLADVPYLFGGMPSIGDFGLIAPLYGHLGRDPVPLRILQTRAFNLLRWVERMNRPEPDIGEYADRSETFLADDTVPDTLIDVLRAFAVDFVPETVAAAHTINAALEETPPPAGSECERGYGNAEFDMPGASISALAQPFRFYLLKRVQDAVANLDGTDREAVLAMLDDANMTPVLDARLIRDIGRQDNLEVWL